MVRNITLPDLSRLDKSKGTLHHDFGFIGLFGEFHPKFDLSRWSVWSGDVEKYFFNYFNTEDASYRCDFLSEWLDDPKARRSFEKVKRAFPNKEADYVSLKKINHWGEEEDYAPSSIRRQISLIRKFLSVTKTLEMMAEMEGASQASRDLRSFAVTTRIKLEDYAEFVRPMLESPQFKDKSSLDHRWANDCLDKIQSYLEVLDVVRKITGEFTYFRNLCLPYELEFEGKRIPSCKPEYLDPEQREGVITGAFNPRYFKFGDVKLGRRYKRIVTGLNRPNDIVWGEKARNNYIHGPNDMGKSVYLRTVALNVHLAMAGVYCFADSAQLSLPGRIFPCLDLGDTLSSGHFVTGAKKVCNMLNDVQNDDLLILDEVAAGTEPEAEREIAKGITDGLSDHGILFYCATHDRESFMDRRDVPGTKILRVAGYDDPDNKYKVWEGIADPGYAMFKAKELGIDPVSVYRKLGQRLVRNSLNEE